MATQDTEILGALEANYEKALGLMPSDLASEFQRRILPRKDLKDYASSISVAIQFKNKTACLQIQNRMIEQFNFRGFGSKLAQKGINPTQVYEQLLKGFFDYK
jgi:hypothetical protein